jgi:hypothetical protein
MIVNTKNGGGVSITKGRFDHTEVAFMQTDASGVSLEAVDARRIIEVLANSAGFKTEPTGNGMGIIIQFPESPAVHDRRDELADKFFDLTYGHLDAQRQHAVEFIIDGEKQRGELK